MFVMALTPLVVFLDTRVSLFWGAAMFIVLLQCSGFWFVFNLIDHAVFHGKVLWDVACLSDVLRTDLFLFLNLLSQTGLLHTLVAALLLIRVSVFFLMGLFCSSMWPRLKFSLKALFLPMMLCAGLCLTFFVMVGADYLLQGRSLTVNLLYLWTALVLWFSCVLLPLTALIFFSILSLLSFFNIVYTRAAGRPSYAFIFFWFPMVVTITVWVLFNLIYTVTFDPYFEPSKFVYYGVALHSDPVVTTVFVSGSHILFVDFYLFIVSLSLFFLWVTVCLSSAYFFCSYYLFHTYSLSFIVWLVALCTSLLTYTLFTLCLCSVALSAIGLTVLIQGCFLYMQSGSPLTNLFFDEALYLLTLLSTLR